MIRRVAAAAVIALSILAFGVPDIGVASPVTAVSTQVSHIRPVNGHGRLLSGYTVSKVLKHGGCIAGSDTTNSAYRCFAGNFVVDPCWASFSKKYVYCLPSAFSFKVIEIKVTKPYDNGGFSKKQSKLPWGVQTSDGTQCDFLDGASAAIHNKRVNYACGKSTLVLYGNVNTSGDVWTIHSANTTKGGKFKPAGIVSLGRAVFGKPSHKA